MSYLAYPPRMPVEFSSSIATLIHMTRAIKQEVAKNKREIQRVPRTPGRTAYVRLHPVDARGEFLKRQLRKSRMWVSISGDPQWAAFAEISAEEQLALHDELLRNLEALFLEIQRGGICPRTKATTLQTALVRHPAISIRQLSESAIISESTAKRWLFALARRGILKSEIHNGQRQFLNEPLIAIINKYV